MLLSVRIKKESRHNYSLLSSVQLNFYACITSVIEDTYMQVTHTLVLLVCCCVFCKASCKEMMTLGAGSGSDNQFFTNKTCTTCLFCQSQN